MHAAYHHKQLKEWQADTKVSGFGMAAARQRSEGSLLSRVSNWVLTAQPVKITM